MRRNHLVATAAAAAAVEKQQYLQVFCGFSKAKQQTACGSAGG
jgi:hypothetical protein